VVPALLRSPILATNRVREAMKSKIELITMLVIGGIAAVVSLADLFGLLDYMQALSGVKEKIPVITLLMTGLLTVYLVFERRGTIDGMHKLLEKLMPHLDRKLDQAHSELAQISQHGAVFFDTAETILEKLASTVVGSESVWALNLSGQRGETPALDDYFSRVQEYILQQGTALRSFKSLANIETPQKAKWILMRANELLHTGKFSQALFPNPYKGNIILGFAVIKKRGRYSTFIFPPVNPSGLMDGILFEDEKMGKVMVKYFEVAWASAVVLHEGRRPNSQGLPLLLEVNPGITTDNELISILRQFESQP